MITARGRLASPPCQSKFLHYSHFFEWNKTPPKKESSHIDHLRSVGKAVVAALRHPEASFNKALKVQSFVVTSRDILNEFEKQTGGAGSWKVTNYTLQQLKDAEQAGWSGGNPNATSFTLRRIWMEGDTLYDETDNERIGLKASDLETLETAVRRALTTGWAESAKL